MPVLRLIRERFERERPLAGLRIGACLHVTTETANLMRTLKAGGATVVLAASNPLSTKDDVAAALVAAYGISVLRPPGRGPRHVLRATSTRSPTRIRRSRWTTAATWSRCSTRSGRASSPRSWPGPRRRRPGVIRLKAMAADGALRFPVVAVNEAQTKHLFDNRYGTGQSTVDGILRATNILLAGRNVVVAGLRLGGAGDRLADERHGRPCRGRRGRPGPGARGAHGRLPGHDGRRGRPLGRAVRHRHRQPQRLPARALRGRCATARSWPTRGHFDAELDLPALREMAEGHVREVRENVQEFDIGGRGSTSSPRAGW